MPSAVTQAARVTPAAPEAHAEGTSTPRRHTAPNPDTGVLVPQVGRSGWGPHVTASRSRSTGRQTTSMPWAGIVTQLPADGVGVGARVTCRRVNRSAAWTPAGRLPFGGTYGGLRMRI